MTIWVWCLLCANLIKLETLPQVSFPILFWVRVGPKRNLHKIWKAQSSKESEESGWVCWQTEGKVTVSPACPHSLHSVSRYSSQVLTLLINCSPGPTLRCVCSPTGLPKARGLLPSLWQLDMLGFWLPGGCPFSSSNPLDLWGVFEAPDTQRKGCSWGSKLCQLYHRRHTVEFGGQVSS